MTPIILGALELMTTVGVVLYLFGVLIGFISTLSHAVFGISARKGADLTGKERRQWFFKRMRLILVWPLACVSETGLKKLLNLEDFK